MAKRKGKYTTNHAQQKSGKRNRSIMIVSICCVVALLAGGLFAALYFINNTLAPTVMQNVKVAGIDVSGMTREEAINAITEKAGNTYKQTPMVVKVNDTVIEISPDVSQATLDVQKAVDEAQQGDTNRNNSGEVLEIDISKYLSFDEEAIRASLQEFTKHYNTNILHTTYEVQGTAPDLKLVVNKGIPSYGLDLEQLYVNVISAYQNKEFTVEASCEMIQPESIDLSEILKEHQVEPVDARFDPETFNVIEEITGCTFDITTAQDKVDATPDGGTVEIVFDQIQPETTAETLSALLFRDELGYHSGFQSSSSNRATNLDLACKAIDGIVLMPGESFSYNETLGERTAERGYKTGIAYVGGKSVPSIGGGICQVSSTLYYSALQADLEILERENHCYAPGYVPLGMDATVSWGALDFCFRNNTQYPIRIEAEADGGTTTVKILGTDTKDYYIKMEYAVTKTYGYETIYEEYAPDNKEGYKDGERITSPATGYDVVTYRCKINKADDKEISRELESRSHFIKRDEVICKIVKPEDPATPPETPITPPETPSTNPEPPVTEPDEPVSPPETPNTDPATPPDETPDPGIGNGNVTESGGSLPE